MNGICISEQSCESSSLPPALGPPPPPPPPPPLPYPSFPLSLPQCLPHSPFRCLLQRAMGSACRRQSRERRRMTSTGARQPGRATLACCPHPPQQRPWPAEHAPDDRFSGQGGEEMPYGPTPNGPGPYIPPQQRAALRYGSMLLGAC